MHHTHMNEDPKARMLKHISILWGVKNTDTLDPLVKMLVEALAGELQKTHHDIHTFETRILEKIASLMTPGILSAPYCAHAIASARPNEPYDVISSSTQFQHTKKKAKDQEPQNILFTPAGNVKLFDASVQYLVTGNTAWRLSEQEQKTVCASGTFQPEHSKTIWLGLNIPATVNSINGMSFYFDAKHTAHNASLFHVLHSANWYLGDRQLITTNGLAYCKPDSPRHLFSDMDAMYQIEQEVRHLYDKHFVTITDHTLEQDNTSYKTALYPSEFQQLFAASFLTSLTEPLVWIKLTMPSVPDAATLAHLTVQINAFPVINRKHIEHTHRFKDITNVIPVQTGTYEYFLSVDELTDSRAKRYTPIPYSENGAASAGSYSLRKGGTGRVDARNAKEYLIHLKDLIRDESAAFASYGQDTVNNLLKEMDKLLAQLDQRIKKHTHFHTDAYYYVTVEHAAYDETFFLHYWVTNSIHANGIYAGTKLNIYKGSQLKSGSAQLLTATTGGKQALEPSRHIDAWKYASLTHNKIVTAEDIKAFCIHELGPKIESVSIRKGLIASTHPKQGLVRCVEVLLKKNVSDATAADETAWDLELKSLQSKMELRSSLNLNMKVLLVD